jgi:hypothetical protein
VNSSINDHPLVEQGYGWWIYKRDSDEEMYSEETVYRYADVSVEQGEIVTRLLDGTSVPIEQVRVNEPTNLKHLTE